MKNKPKILNKSKTNDALENASVMEMGASKNSSAHCKYTQTVDKQTL